MARRARIGGQEAFDGPESATLRKTQAVIEPTYGIGKAATYIGDQFYMKLKASQNDNTTYHIDGEGRGSVYDSGSFYRQVVSVPKVIAMEVLLPSNLADLKTGDKISIAGADWTVSEVNSFGSKSIKASRDGQEITLGNGYRINGEQSGDRNYNWKIAINRATSRRELFGLEPQTGTRDRLWIYNEDSLIGKKFTEGQELNFPSYFGGKANFDGLTYAKQTGFSIASLTSTDYPVSINGARETVTAKAIQIHTDGPKITIGNEQVDVVYIVPETSHIPSLGAFVMYKPVGEGEYRIGPSNFTISDGAGAEGLEVRANFAESSLEFTERVRPDQGNYPKQFNYLKLPWTQGSDTWRFKESDTSVSNIFYQSINDTTYSYYEPPVTTERGSQWHYVTTIDASFTYSSQIRKAQWSVVQEGGTTGIRDIGKITPAGVSVGKNYPNPFGAQGTRVPITLSKETGLSVKVFNALGQEVKTIENGANYSSGKHEFGIDLQGLPSGIYFCKVATAEGTQSVKMNYRQ